MLSIIRSILEKNHSLPYLGTIISHHWNYCMQYCWYPTMKNINEEDSKNGTQMVGSGVWGTLQAERQGLKADVAKVSMTRKTWVRENHLSCKPQTTRKKRFSLKTFEFYI